MAPFGGPQVNDNESAKVRSLDTGASVEVRRSEDAPGADVHGEADISGAEVPKPTTTMPIKKVEIPNWLASSVALSTSRSALHIRRKKPAIIRPMARSIV